MTDTFTYYLRPGKALPKTLAYRRSNEDHSVVERFIPDEQVWLPSFGFAVFGGLGLVSWDEYMAEAREVSREEAEAGAQ